MSVFDPSAGGEAAYFGPFRIEGGVPGSGSLAMLTGGAILLLPRGHEA